MDLELLTKAKAYGFSDRQIAHLTGRTEDEVRAERKAAGLVPSYRLVDTCAAEFEAYTPYYYSTYDRGDDEINPTDRKKVMILGGGPNRIGQGIEFDYCCVHAAFALREAGFETIMVNSNPETVSTDYDTSDKLYFEPLTLEDVLHIYERENCWGVIPQFGGQTPLNLAKDLQRNGVNVIGTSPENIEAAEDRRFFQELALRLGIQQPPNDTATNTEEAVAIATRIGYPVLVRPSFVLGGRAMVIVYDENQLRQYMHAAVQASAERPVLIDSYLEAAVEVDVDCISDGNMTVIGAIIEHVEEAGVHSGDSACVIPAPTLDSAIKDRIREYSQALAKELNVIGLMNIQYAVQDDEVYILEVNPRASRTIPFVSKAIGVPLAKYASLIMVGKTLTELGFTAEVTPPQVSVKEAVFPFIRFPGTDITLSPEMKSTGEVMGIDVSTGMAYLKSQLAAGNKLPRTGNIFLSVRDADKENVLDGAQRLESMGFTIYATAGTGAYLRAQGVASRELEKISNGSPNVLDLIADRNLAWIVNTPTGGAAPRVDEIRMRGESVINSIPITTTVAGFIAAVSGLEALQDVDRMDVRTIQEYHAVLNG